MAARDRPATQACGSGRVAKALRYLRTEGLPTFCRSLFRLATGPLASTTVVYDVMLPCSEGMAVVPAAVEAEVVEVGEDYVPILDALMNQPATLIRERLRRGERCFVIEVAGSPGGSVWVVEGPRAQVVPGLDLAPGEAYLCSARVLPHMRGKGLGTQLESAVPARLAQEGFCAVFARIENTNVGGLRAAAKAGFKIVAALRYRRRLGRVRVEKLPLPPESAAAGR